MKNVFVSFGVLAFFVCSFFFSPVFADEITYGSDSADAVASQMIANGATFQYSGSTSTSTVSGSLNPGASTSTFSNLLLKESNGANQRWSMDLNSSSGAYGTLAKKSNSIYNFSGYVSTSYGSISFNSVKLSTTNSQHLRNYNLTNFDFTSIPLYFAKNSSADYYFVLKANTNTGTLNSITCSDSSYDVSFESKGLVMYFNDLFCYYVVKVSGENTGRLSLLFNGLNSSSYTQPLYWGIAESMPSEYYSIAFGKEKGTFVDANKDSVFVKDDTGVSDSLASSNTQLSDNISQVDKMQDTYTSQMSSSFEQIDTTSSLVTQGQFVQSAKWVATQFDDLLNIEVADGSKPFNLLLFYSLIFGIAMIMIGKIRS